MRFNIFEGDSGRLLDLDRVADPADIVHYAKTKDLAGVILREPVIEYLSNDIIEALTWARVLSISGNPKVELSWISLFQKIELFIFNGEPGLRLDLSSCRSLREVNVSWTDELTGLESLPNLHHIDIWGYPYSDFTRFLRMESVTSLVLRNPKIRSLNGLELFPNLRALTVGPCRLLTSIESIDSVSRLEQLSFEGCRKIVDFSAISRLKQLQALEFVNCGKIQSLSFLRSLPKLKVFSMLAETEVVDAEISMLKDLQSYAIRPRKAYRPIIDDSKGEIPADFFINARFR